MVVRGRKPNSVVGDHSSGTDVAIGLKHATRPIPRTAVPENLVTNFRGDCLRLHAVGFAVP